MFEFETVKLDIKGKTIERYKRQANQYIEDLGNGIKLEMVEIPAGTFLMGSPSSEVSRSSDEGPQHQVTVPKFYIGKYPITQEQYQMIMGNNPSYFKGDNLPVEQVSWYDAVEFSKKLSEKTGKTYRLPSEAEWEYACRAGTTPPFAFGQTITTDIVNCDGKSTPYGELEINEYEEVVGGEYRNKTLPVGSLGIANDFGLYDCHGNVREWCQDHWHNSYKGAPIDASSWENISIGNINRVVRGGSWDSYAEFCRSACRMDDVPDGRSNDLGFRIVLVAYTCNE